MKKAILLVIGSLLFVGMLCASQINILVELFSQSGCSYCPSAQLGQEQLYDGHPHVVPILWYGGYSPNYSARASFYGVSGIPHARFAGNESAVGGSTSGSTYPTYLNKYNSIINRVSPFEMSNTFYQIGDQFAVTTNIAITENFTSTNTKVVTVLVKHDPTVRRFLGIAYHEQDLTISNVGSSDAYLATFPNDPTYNLDQIKAVTFVQTFANDKEVFQSCQSDFAGELPILCNFVSSITHGPKDLTVDFNDISLSTDDIISWEWDFDGDGVTDSEEQNPTFTYTEPGTYSVSLTIFNGEVTETKVIEDMITVYDTDNVQGMANGVWTPEYGVYNVVGNVIVPDNASLTILPGTQINFNENTGLYVHGSLIADGTAASRISFGSDSSWDGILIENNEGELVFNNCDFNYATKTAMKIKNTSISFNSCKFEYNSAGATPGAMSIEGIGLVNINQSYFTNNEASNNAGAISINQGEVKINNSIIANNTGQNAGAITLNNSANLTLRNTTIANNESLSPSGAQIMNIGSLTNVMNSIFFGTNDILNLAGMNTITYSRMINNASGEGCITTDPMFVNPSNGLGSLEETQASDWMLQENSPCIDAGNPDAQYNDKEDPASPGNALYPSLGTVRNDMGAFGGQNRYDDSVSNDENTIIKPKYLSLSAYPNPFNPNVNIEFNRTKNSPENIQVDIYNVRGQKVKNLLNQYTNEKTIRLSWNGLNENGKTMPSGIYFIKATSSNDVLTKKVILLK